MAELFNNQDSTLSDRYIELRRVARCISMFEATDADIGNDDTFTSLSSPLHSERMNHGKQHNKLYAVMPAQKGQINWLDSGHDTRREHLLKSGPLGLCKNHDSISCPAPYKTIRGNYKRPVHLESKVHRFGGAEGWTKKSLSFLNSYIPVINPHGKVVQRWNKVFIISCMLAIFIDPLFFFPLRMQLDNKCVILNWHLALAISTVRTVSDFIYLLHMLLQLRLAYVAPESRVVGTGDLVDQPKKIAYNYLCGYFIFDLVAVFPLPQVMLLEIGPRYLRPSSASYSKTVLRGAVLLQYVLRMIRFIPLLAGYSPSGFIFESGWANFIIIFLLFMLAGHIIGSLWYLFGLQRIKQCLHNACSQSQIPSCNSFIDCGRGNKIESFRWIPAWQDWLNNSDASNCFNTSGNFNYGIYQRTVLLTTMDGVVPRYIVSLAWGFLQVSTLAGNLMPSYFEGEILFNICIIGTGDLLFALLIANIQSQFQGLGRRRVEMQLRLQDVEQWMSHRCFPENLRRKIRRAEIFRWVATQGVNEEELLNNLPENLQREIRCHLFRFLKRVPLFSLMDEPILDAICQKLCPKLFLRGSDVLYQGGTVEKMFLIVRGKLESIGADGNRYPLSEGDVCGEELLRWCLEQFSVQRGGKIRLHGQRLFSNRTIRCLTNVETFALHVADLEEVVALFARFLRNSRVQGAIRYESPYWRTVAAIQIQVAWRYRQRHLKQTDNCNHGPTHSKSHIWKKLTAELLDQKYEVV